MGNIKYRSVFMTDRQITTVNPFTEANLDSYPLMTAEQASAAVEDCHKAFLDWRLVSLKDRAEKIRAIGRELRNSKEDYARLMTAEMGKLLSDSRDEIDLCAAICDWTADNGPDHLADETREVMGARKGIVTYQPTGVIYGIQPWNFPLYQAARYTIANLMAGNGVLLKHAANVSGSGLMLRDVIERAGLPKNLFTVLLIDHDTSEKVIEHKLVRGVTLTGSSAAGRIVAAQAGKALKKTVMELGSNDAYLVLSDADLDLAVKTCVTGRVYNNGQTCVNAKRFVVVDAIYDQFIAAYTKAMDAVTMGDPTQEGIGLGPMARKDLRDDLHKQVLDSIEKGAKLLCGGDPCKGR